MHSPLLHSLIWRGHKVNYAGKKPPPPPQKNVHIYVVRIPNLLRRLLMRMMFRPLHGLPVLIKGNIGTRDRMQTNGESIEINLGVQI